MSMAMDRRRRTGGLVVKELAILLSGGSEAASDWTRPAKKALDGAMSVSNVGSSVGGSIFSSSLETTGIK